jgi:hypothetical protein
MPDISNDASILVVSVNILIADRLIGRIVQAAIGMSYGSLRQPAA